jgi:arginine decarboxylase-like protein
MTPEKEMKQEEHPGTGRQWSVEDARELYGIDRWGLRYFAVNPEGDVTVAPLKEKGASIRILDVVHEARQQGLHFPMLIRLGLTVPSTMPLPSSTTGPSTGASIPSR